MNLAQLKSFCLNHEYWNYTIFHKFLSGIYVGKLASANPNFINVIPRKNIFSIFKDWVKIGFGSDQLSVNDFTST